MSEDQYFFCIECGSHGDCGGSLIADWCPECGSHTTWVKICKKTKYSNYWLSSISLDSEDRLAWGEYDPDGYHFVRLPKNYLPVTTFIAAQGDTTLIDPVLLMMIGYIP